MCSGCMACADICSKNAISIVDNLKAYNAVIDESKCVSCNACFKVCQQLAPLKGNKPYKWFQGWAENISYREQGSSGGVGTALIEYFSKNLGYVAACSFDQGLFGFFLFGEENDSAKPHFGGSKYVKSNPKGIYNKIKKIISSNKVLFIGLPCQVAAIKKICGDNDNLYTVDLICHGSPSPKVLEIFLEQYGIKLSQLNDIIFRKKLHFQVYKDNNSGEYKGIEKEGVTDNYLISFLNGDCYTENCYYCKYANINRISDITIGDSWGSELDISEKKKGISLILCQSPKGYDLVNKAGIVKKPVDLETAISHNGQLDHPSLISKKRDHFFKMIDDGDNFDRIVWRLYPKEYVKQKLKKLLITLHIWGV